MLGESWVTKHVKLISSKLKSDKKRDKTASDAQSISLVKQKTGSSDQMCFRDSASIIVSVSDCVNKLMEANVGIFRK